MKPLDLKEWAEALLLSPDSEQAGYGGEVLELIASGERLDELEAIAGDILGQCPDPSRDEAQATEWIIDRHQLLAELEDVLDQNGFSGDAGKALDDLLAEYDDMATQIENLTNERDDLAKELEAAREGYDL